MSNICSRIKEVSTTDAYALSLLGQVPRQFRKEMWDQQISLIPVSDEARQLVESELSKVEVKDEPTE